MACNGLAGDWVLVACEQVYTNIRKFKEDLGRYPPHHFVCVPLVLDTLYGRVRTRSLCPTLSTLPRTLLSHHSVRRGGRSSGSPRP